MEKTKFETKAGWGIMTEKTANSKKENKTNFINFLVDIKNNRLDQKIIEFTITTEKRKTFTIELTKGMTEYLKYMIEINKPGKM